MHNYMSVALLVYFDVGYSALSYHPSAFIFALCHYFQAHPNWNPINMIVKKCILLNKLLYSRGKCSWLWDETLGSAEIMKKVLSKFSWIKIKICQ